MTLVFKLHYYQSFLCKDITAQKVTFDVFYPVLVTFYFFSYFMFLSILPSSSSSTISANIIVLAISRTLSENIDRFYTISHSLKLRNFVEFQL